MLLMFDNSEFSQYQISLAKVVTRPAKLNQSLAEEIKSLADPQNDGFQTVTGKTLATDDFYEGIFFQIYFFFEKF